MKRKIFLKRVCLGVMTCSLFLGMGTFSACNGGENSASGPDAEQTDPDAKYYTVTLDPNGGAFADGTREPKVIQVAENGKIKFADYGVTYEGNELYGWYYTDGKPFPAARKITGNITIKAKWSVAEEKEDVNVMLVDYTGKQLSIEYENGVYQFYKNSPIYGGYAQRGGKYTAYEDDLLNGLNGVQPGEKAVCVYTAKSNYVDTTGGCYAEFFNDGTVELIYDYKQGETRTKYTMEVLAYTVVGFEMPFEAPALPDVSGTAMNDDGSYNVEALASKSVHYADNDEALAGGPGSLEDPFTDTGSGEGAFKLSEKADTSGDKSIFVRYAANNGSTTMFLQFNTDKTYTVKMNYGDYGLVDVGVSGTWAVADGALTVEGKGTLTEENGRYSFADGNGNTYAFEVTDFVVKLSEIIDVSDGAVRIRYGANNGSETMFLQLNTDKTYTVRMNYGDYGLVDVGVSGTWAITDGALTLEGAGTLTETNGVYVFEDGKGNTYAFLPFAAE